MTPTGKATDRVRAVFERHKIAGVDVSTIHSFLASNGRLNDNQTFKRWGGKRSDLEGTIVIDETSMLDLAHAATLFRSIEWQNVKRLIRVRSEERRVGKSVSERVDLSGSRLIKEQTKEKMICTETYVE